MKPLLNLRMSMLRQLNDSRSHSNNLLTKIKERASKTISITGVIPEHKVHLDPNMIPNITTNFHPAPSYSNSIDEGDTSNIYMS